MKSPQVLMITIHYRPETNFVTTDIAERMQQEGCKVTVVTTFPNYPLGRYFEGFGSWLPKSEVINGVRVVRVPTCPTRSLSVLKRGFFYLSFAFMAALVAPLVCFRPRTVIAYQTPFFSALASLFFKVIYRSKLVYICVDLWPESFLAAKVGSKKWLVKLMYWYSAWINRFADIIVSTTPGMTERYLRDGVAEENIRYIPIWVDASRAAMSALEVVPEDDPVSIVYAGNIGPAQGLETVIEAATLLQERGSKAEFVFYGTGASEQTLKDMVRERALANVSFRGRVSSEQVGQICSQATAQLVHLIESPQFLFTVPSKLLFSLAAGRPILGGLAGDAAKILNDSAAGINVPPSNPEALAEAVLQLERMSAAERAAMGAKGRAYFAEHFHPDLLLKQYQDIV